MKVSFLSGELGATFVARILPLAKFLEKYGINCKIISPVNWGSLCKGKLKNILSIILTHKIEEYVNIISSRPSVVIIGRTSTPQMFLLQKLLKMRGIKIIFDLNDALFLPISNFLFANIRPGSFCLEKIIKSADWTTVNGHYLLGYVKLFNKKATIIHDPIDTRLFSPTLKKTHDKITIGWEGVPRHHYGNLALLIKPLMKLAKKYDIRFKIVSYLGDLRVKEMFCKLEKLMEIDYGLKQWVPMSNLPKLLSDFDIMVAPLQKTPWYEGKSALRVGIGMAMGIPVVASPAGEQKYVVKHGVNGFLARNEEDWYNYLRILIEDEKLRRKMGGEGRKTAEKELSLEVNGKNYMKLLDVSLASKWRRVYELVKIG